MRPGVNKTGGRFRLQLAALRMRRGKTRTLGGMSTRIAIWLTMATLFTLAPLSPAWCDPKYQQDGRYQAPKEFASLAELRAWLEKYKGHGFPQTVESKLIGLHVFVAWNNPFSGRSGYYTWAYVEKLAKARSMATAGRFFL